MSDAPKVADMKIRERYSQPEHVPFDSVAWVASPEPGVERKMLERDGEEVARATSIVRYAPGSEFSEHVHDRGEEYLVLEGTFEDENGSYPRGTYVRNPPGSHHRPFSRDGAMIFVKLRQFAGDDTVQRVVRADDGLFPTDGPVRMRAMHEHGSERVSLVELSPASELCLNEPEKGTEILVLYGSMELGDGRFVGPLAWVRLPGALGRARSAEGCSFWMKRGHLPPEVR